MKSSPAIQFYPGDWLRDICLRSCSLAARGLWIDMLSFMHEAEPYGHLRVNGQDIQTKQLARMVGVPVKVVTRLLAELESAGVFSTTVAGTLFSRRMVRDQELRERRGKYGYLSEKHPDVPRKKDSGMDTIAPSIGASIGVSPSSSSSSSSSKKKKPKNNLCDAPTALREQFEQEFWNLYPMRNGRKLGKDLAFTKWMRLSEADKALIAIAVKNLAADVSKHKTLVKDAHRFIENGWREWLEPAATTGGIQHENLNGKNYRDGLDG